IDPTDIPVVSQRDSMVELSFRMIESNIYFKLKMLNETKNGYYSMVRVFEDGSSESVDIRQMVANEINQPILYCFTDEEVPTVDFTYVLVRITAEYKEVKRWNYCATTKLICPQNSQETLVAQQ
ncbi:MAG: hypothetical protein HRT57_11550, partial [Crocinitomicaceae bacterium]|nr:hypothetical protein [Crocinitomicaceae bacterium]